MLFLEVSGEVGGSTELMAASARVIGRHTMFV
jgi:hypothetical protein